MLLIRSVVFAALLVSAYVSVSAQPAYAQVQQNVSVGDIAGNYGVRGRNPDGSGYKGSLSIVDVDGIANFEWNVAGRTYKGQGSFIGNVLVVNWGSSHPVLYTVDLNGNLAGTWNDGQASERLTRK